jgi:hypothetical protein
VPVAPVVVFAPAAAAVVAEEAGFGIELVEEQSFFYVLLSIYTAPYF